eukprot:747232-Hanusia_phi.AAC.3
MRAESDSSKRPSTAPSAGEERMGGTVRESAEEEGRESVKGGGKGCWQVLMPRGGKLGAEGAEWPDGHACIKKYVEFIKNNATNLIRKSVLVVDKVVDDENTVHRNIYKPVQLVVVEPRQHRLNAEQDENNAHPD